MNKERSFSFLFRISREICYFILLGYNFRYQSSQHQPLVSTNMVLLLGPCAMCNMKNLCPSIVSLLLFYLHKQLNICMFYCLLPFGKFTDFNGNYSWKLKEEKLCAAIFRKAKALWKWRKRDIITNKYSVLDSILSLPFQLIIRLLAKVAH